MTNHTHKAGIRICHITPGGSECFVYTQNSFEISNVKLINNASNSRIRKTICQNWPIERKEYIFLLRFGLAKAIHNYLRLKFVLCVQGIVNLKCLLNKFIIPNSGHIYFFISETFEINV